MRYFDTGVWRRALANTVHTVGRGSEQSTALEAVFFRHTDLGTLIIEFNSRRSWWSWRWSKVCGNAYCIMRKNGNDQLLHRSQPVIDMIQTCGSAARLINCYSLVASFLERKGDD